MPRAPLSSSSAASVTADRTARTDGCTFICSRSLPLRRTSHLSVNDGARATSSNAPFPARVISASPVQPESVTFVASCMTSTAVRAPTLRPANVTVRVRSWNVPPTVIVSMTVAEAFSPALRISS